MKIINENETKLKDREPLNKININKKAKAQIELENLAMESIIRVISPELATYNEALHATAKFMTKFSADKLRK